MRAHRSLLPTRNWLRGPALGATAAAAAASLMWPNARTAVARPEVGRPAPGFVLRDADGATWSLTGLRGQPVFLAFVCGCSSCRRLVRTWKALRRQCPGVRTVWVTGLGAADAVALARSAGMGHPLLLDHFSAVAEAWGVDACPRCFLIDAGGMLVYASPDGGLSRAEVRELTERLGRYVSNE